jgi:hypothetical protein
MRTADVREVFLADVMHYFTPVSVTPQPSSDRRRRAVASCGFVGV